MSRLDDIKARVGVVRAKKDACEPNYDEFAAIIRLANFDAPALVAAVEAVLALHVCRDSLHGGGWCQVCADRWGGSYNFPCPTLTAIREALGETE